jgi:integrase
MMRIGEIVNLTWDSLDLRRRIIVAATPENTDSDDTSLMLFH